MDPIRLFISLPFQRDGNERDYPDCIRDFKAPELNRYLRALRVRLERADQSYGRDRTKGEAVTPFIDKFHLLYDAGVSLEDCRPFFDLFLLVQEARIAAWSPELPTVQKATPATLQAALSAVPLSAIPRKS